jgi:hypothetical protein
MLKTEDLPVCRGGAGLPPSAPAKKADPCPPEWLVQLAALRAADDDLLLAHMAHCNRCAGVFAGELNRLQKPH